MKKIITLICLVGMMQNGFAKWIINCSYYNYTQNINISQNSTSIININVNAEPGDSVIFCASKSDFSYGTIYASTWRFNNVIIPNAGGVQGCLSVIINQSGIYSANVGANFIVTITTGIPSIKNINFLNVFPTAVTSSITIQLNSIKTNDVEISFFDVNGRKLKNDFYKNVFGEFIKNENTEALAKGIYFLRIKTGEDVMEKKFVKL